MKQQRKVFDPTLCVTHSCNLNCVYCYQKHKSVDRMDFETAKASVDYIFTHIPEHAVDGVTLNFMGGEPLLEFGLLKQVYEYAMETYPEVKKVFFATTNGTLLTEEMKEWFRVHRHNFVLGLSLDGTAEVHNNNRSGCFEKIDIEFFVTNWPEQGVKMTLSEYSIPRLAESVWLRLPRIIPSRNKVHSTTFVKTAPAAHPSAASLNWSFPNSSPSIYNSLYYETNASGSPGALLL